MGWFWFASSVGAAFETRESPGGQFRVLDGGSWHLVLHQAGPEARYCVRGAESRPIRVSTASGRRPPFRALQGSRDRTRDASPGIRAGLAPDPITPSEKTLALPDHV